MSFFRSGISNFQSSLELSVVSNRLKFTTCQQHRTLSVTVENEGWWSCPTQYSSDLAVHYQESGCVAQYHQKKKIDERMDVLKINLRQMEKHYFWLQKKTLFWWDVYWWNFCNVGLRGIPKLDLHKRQEWPNHSNSRMSGTRVIIHELHSPKTKRLESEITLKILEIVIILEMINELTFSDHRI